MTGLEPDDTVSKVIIAAIRADQRATESQLHDERNAHLATKLEREAWRKRAIAAKIVGDSALLLDRIERLTKERDAYRASRVELREALRVMVDTAIEVGKLLDAEVMPSDTKKEG